MYFSKSPAIGLCSVEPTKRETGCVRPFPAESIRQHFTPSVNISMYFSKSLAIGLPLSRTEKKRDGSWPSVCDGVDPQTFYTLFKHLNLFFKVSRDRTSAQSNRHQERRVVSVRVRPCPMESIRQRFTPFVNTSVYFKSLALGLPVSRTVAHPIRSDSVRVYWTCMKMRQPRPIKIIKS